ncbi:MAG: hypothetical protein KIT31_21755 [Deltaproteobacteria bacterium]|nr:hypothetical protein [Deltaproteobacteria bacterium]
MRAQPIALLHPTALALPLPWLVDRYVELVVQRRTAVAALLAADGAPYGILRAHRDVVYAARRIANVLARAGRTAEIHARISPIKTIGYDRDLAMRVELATDQPTPMAYVTLAGALRTHEKAPDPAAALAVCNAGLARFPGDPELLAAAADSARFLGRVEQAIALYEQALRADTDAEVDLPAALRLGKLYAERIGRIAAGGRPRAATLALGEVREFTAKLARSRPSHVWGQVVAIAESALGKGLAGQGLVDDGRRVLTTSLAHAPSIDAFEALSRLETQLDAFAAGRGWAQRGLDLLGSSAGDRYRRAKLARIAGDAMRRAGKPREAEAHYRDAVRAWASLGEDKELAPQIVAERYLDGGRARWWIGDAMAVEHVLKAVDLLLGPHRDATSDEIPAGVVAFLIQAGRYHDALDAYHRGLGEPSGGEAYKVYTSLWILVEARRLGHPPDRLATEYLASRTGDLWYERLARAASGKLSYDQLRASAATGPQKGELAFYGAMLGLDPRAATPGGRRALLEATVAARSVFDAEYDLARLYLAAL